MGQEILYCSRCQTRIVGADFDKGVAFRVGEQTACAKCTMEMLPTLPLPAQEQILAQKRRAADAREKKPSPPALGRPTASSTQMRTPATDGATSRTQVTLLIGVGVALVVIVGMSMMSRGSSAPPGPPAPETLAKAADPGASPHDQAAQGALQLALSFARENPTDFDDQARMFQRIIGEYPRTPACAEAKSELAKIPIKRKEAAAAELATLLSQARDIASTQEFQRALDLLAEARKSRSDPESVRAIEEKTREIEATMAAAFPALRDQAVAARKREMPAEVQNVRTTISRWNSPKYAAELEQALGAVPPPVTTKPNGNLMLRIAEATVVGSKIKRVGQGEWSILQGWIDPKDYVEWDVVSSRAGAYTLNLNYTCPKEFMGAPNGGEFSVTVGGESKTFTVETTKTWGDYTTFTFGTFNLPGGACKVIVRPTKIVHVLMSLRFVQFVPVK